MTSSRNHPTLIFIFLLCIFVLAHLEARTFQHDGATIGGGGDPSKPVTELSTYKPETAPRSSSANVTAHCSVDTLELGWCADLLSGLVHETLGDPNLHKCCPVLDGLLELEASACICTAIHLKVLDINVAIPIALELLVNCGKQPPQGFKCLPY